MSINTDSYVLNYSLYQAALKEIRKSKYILDENDVNIKDKKEIFELAQKVITKVKKVVEEETNLAHETAANILGFFENIDMEDEMDASDICENRLQKSYRP